MRWILFFVCFHWGMTCDSGLSIVSGNYGPCDCFWSFCHDVRKDYNLFWSIIMVMILVHDKIRDNIYCPTTRAWNAINRALTREYRSRGNVSASNGLQENRAGIQFLQAEPFNIIVLMLSQKDFGGTNLNPNLFSVTVLIASNENEWNWCGYNIIVQFKQHVGLTFHHHQTLP
jgi:hypothetical protein